MHADDIGEQAVEESAIRSIVERAIKDVGDGSSRVSQHLLFGSPIHVKEGPGKKLLIEVELTVPCGVFIPDAMQEVQDGIRTALASTLGVQNVAVNVLAATVIADPAHGESNGLSELMGRGMQVAKNLVDGGLKPIKEKAVKIDAESTKG